MLNEQEQRAELIASLKRWKSFIEVMDSPHRKLLWKSVFDKNPLYQKLLK